MTHFVGQTADGAYKLVIEDAPLAAIDRMCASAKGKETGGILIGRYTNDYSTATIMEASEPPQDSRTGATWFNRGVAGLRQLLARRWRASSRSYYLGEWHYHPARVIVPSGEDWAQMASIAEGHEYKCREPILLIAGQPAAAGQHRPFRAFVCPAGQDPAEIIPTADLEARPLVDELEPKKPIPASRCPQVRPKP